MATTFPKRRPPDVIDTETRWPPILALVLILCLVNALPGRYQAVGTWFPWVLVGTGIGSMLAVSFARGNRFWHRFERITLIALFAIACVANVLSIGRLVQDMIGVKHGFDSITLLETATEMWAVNILVFALLYWQVDRPATRTDAADFVFAEKEKNEAWEPRFVDYLFAAFATSTSFTAPDYSRPATPRAKLMLMAQATISLTVLFLIASRAIATLS
jgi:hypothetical protein